MAETLELYVKSTSNYPAGLPLTFFEQLSETWNGESITLPFGEEGEETHEVVGWTDLFFGQATLVNVTKVRTGDGLEGYLVWGGNSGVRILYDEEEARQQDSLQIIGFERSDAHLPAGYGQPIVWIEDLQDLPEEVQQVVEPQEGR